MNLLYAIRHEKQHPFSHCSLEKYTCTLSPHVALNPISYLEDELPDGPKAVLNLLFKLAGKYNKKLYPSLEYIANKLGVSVKSVQRYNDYLYEKGLITWRTGYVGRCNQYKYHEMFDDLEVRKELRFVFRAFYFLPLSLLMIIPTWGDIVSTRSHYIFHTSRRVSNYKEIRSIYNNVNVNDNVSTSDLYCKESTINHQHHRERMEKMEVKDYKNIERLNLTKAGEAKLSAFPPEAIEYGYKVMRSFKKEINEPFKLLWCMAKKYCEENSIAINKSEMMRRLQQEGVKIEDAGCDRDNPYVLRSVTKSLESSKRMTEEALASVRRKPKPEKPEEWEAAMRKVREVQCAQQGPLFDFEEMRNAVLECMAISLEKSRNAERESNLTEVETSEEG